MNNDRLLYRRGILQLVASGFFLSTAGIALRLVEQADGWQILFYRSLALSITILLILNAQGFLMNSVDWGGMIVCWQCFSEPDSSLMYLRCYIIL